MTQQRILLTVTPELYEAIQQKAQQRYATIQQYITETIRNTLFEKEVESKKTEVRNKKEMRGRPAKIDEVKFLQRKKFFTTKHGKKYMF